MNIRMGMGQPERYVKVSVLEPSKSFFVFSHV